MDIRSTTKKILFCVLLLQNVLCFAQHDTLNVSLDNLFKMASEASTQIKRSNAVYEKSRVVLQEKKNNRLPTAGLTASAGYLTNVGVLGLGTMGTGFYDMPHFSNSYALQAGWLLYSGGKVKSGIGLAEIENRMAGLDLTKDSQDIRLLLAGYYLDLYRGYNKKKVYEKNIILSRNLLDKINNRYQSGAALKSDRIRNELLVSTYELALSKLMDSIAIINYNILTILDLPEDTVIIPADIELPAAAQQFIVQGNSSDLLKKALGSNADYQKYTLGVAAAEQKHKQIKAADYPEIELFANSTFARPYTFDIPAKDIYAYNNVIGVKLSYSISNLYQNQRKKEVTDKDIAIAKFSEKLAKESLSREVNSSFIRLKQAFDQLNTLYKQQELADENYKRISDSYLEELVLNTEVTDASNQKLDAGLRVTDARSEILFYYFQLLKSLGEL